MVTFSVNYTRLLFNLKLSQLNLKVWTVHESPSHNACKLSISDNRQLFHFNSLVVLLIWRRGIYSMWGVCFDIYFNKWNNYGYLTHIAGVRLDSDLLRSWVWQQHGNLCSFYATNDNDRIGNFNYYIFGCWCILS